MISYIFTLRIPAAKVKVFLRYMKAFSANWQKIEDENDIFKSVEDKWTFGEYETFQFVVACYQSQILTNILIDFLMIFDCPAFFCDRSEDPFSRKLEPWIWAPGMDRKPRHKALREALMVFFMMRINRVRYTINRRLNEAVQKRQIALKKLDEALDEHLPF